MARHVAVILIAILAPPAAQAFVSRGSSSAFLATKDGEHMRPDVVANTLVHVEDEWRKQAAIFTEENTTSKETPASFAKSCATVVSAVIQGSGGDRTVAKEYMGKVCNQKVLEGWHKLRCTALASAITEHSMLADNYANRENLNPMKVCSGFWTIFVETEKNREAEEAKARAEQDKIRAEQEKKDAAAAAEAQKKAEAAAKAEAELRAKEDARREQEEKEMKAKRDAEEAKARATEAAARLAQKKAEAEKVQQEAQQKMEEAEKAEKEHEERLAEHQKAQENLVNATKSVSTNSTQVSNSSANAAVEPAALKPKTAAVAKLVAKPVSEAKAVADTKPSLLEQDPCAGCDTALAQAYQTCASKHGNPCAETNEAGLVTSGPGQKKDIGCCMKKEKHDRCLQCSSMDCAHKTCNVNKKYYSTYTIVDKLDDKKAMKKSGWGL